MLSKKFAFIKTTPKSSSHSFCYTTIISTLKALFNEIKMDDSLPKVELRQTFELYLALGRQAQAASERAREMAKTDGGGGPLAQARRDLADARKSQADSRGKDSKKGDEPAAVAPSKRTTPPKNRPTPSSSSSKRSANRPKNRPSSSKKRRS